MQIKILHLVQGAGEARGLTVIIDVFRAFSVAAYAFAAGAERIIPVGGLEEARRLKAENPLALLVGERDERKPEGFDFGNSPSQLLHAGLKGKTIIHTTSAGTQGIVNAVHADEILTGSFVNAGAIARYIRKQEPARVSLVCMGYSAKQPVEEDNFCAEYIKNDLEGRENNFGAMTEIIRTTSGARFFDENRQSFAPSDDFDLCLALNRFEFVIRAEKKANYHEMRMIPV